MALQKYEKTALFYPALFHRAGKYLYLKVDNLAGHVDNEQLTMNN